VHINKGRLHAFRKLAPTNLRPHDCHFALRQNLLSSLTTITEQLCISVAWDWMYRGTTAEGVNREMTSMLECASLNRRHLTQSLAIPETCVLQTAQIFTALLKSQNRQPSFLPTRSSLLASSHLTPQKLLTTLMGLLPSLLHIVRRHKAAQEMAHCAAVDKTSAMSIIARRSKVFVAKCPDTWENPQIFTVDPHGNDFFCKICNEELSNVYLHCNGCEVLLNKDFNICITCHAERLYARNIAMHPLNNKRHATINHTGDFQHFRQARCPCKNGPSCKACGYCCGCSCTCHQSFTLRQRFMTIGREYELLKDVQQLVKNHPGCCKLPYIKETRLRLENIRPIPSTDAPSPYEIAEMAPKLQIPVLSAPPPRVRSVVPKKKLVPRTMDSAEASFVVESASDGYKPKPSTSRQIAMMNGESGNKLESLKQPVPRELKPVHSDWSPEEEEILLQAYNQVGKGNWASISVVCLPLKTNEQCRQRINRYKRDGLVTDVPAKMWSDEESDRLEKAFDTHFDDWDAVAKEVGNGRTPLQVSYKFESTEFS